MPKYAYALCMLDTDIRWWEAVTGPRYGLKFATHECDIRNCMKKNQLWLFLFHSLVAYPGSKKTLVKYDFGLLNNNVATKEQKKISEEAASILDLVPAAHLQVTPMHSPAEPMLWFLLKKILLCIADSVVTHPLGAQNSGCDGINLGRYKEHKKKCTCEGSQDTRLDCKSFSAFQELG